MVLRLDLGSLESIENFAFIRPTLPWRDGSHETADPEAGWIGAGVRRAICGISPARGFVAIFERFFSEIRYGGGIRHWCGIHQWLEFTCSGTGEASVP